MKGKKKIFFFFFGREGPLFKGSEGRGRTGDGDKKEDMLLL